MEASENELVESPESDTYEAVAESKFIAILIFHFYMNILKVLFRQLIYCLTI